MPEIGASTKFTFTIDGLPTPTYVARFEAVEAMSTLFEVELTLTSEDKDIAVADVVGQSALLTLEADGSEPRYFHGIVSRFRHAEDGKKLTVYHATMVPKLWRLLHRHDSRIFQEETVPAIIEKVLDGAGVTDYRLSLSGSYSAREYCVQYRESDFAFISRLMEEEGIHYFFEHTDGSHVLVLADAPSAAMPIPAPDTIAFRAPLGAMAHGESVSRFSTTEEVRPGKVTLTDYNFKKPSLSLLGSTAASLDTDLEVYDYPGEYELPGDASTLTKVRLEEWQSRRAVADGESGCIRMTPGYVFTLTDAARDADNRGYLLTRVRHKGAQPQMVESGAGDAAISYGNTFSAMPGDVPFRPERRTPRPAIKGVQTAIVTGPGGEEVYTDEHGRVKVHFHWDRLGTKDDMSSCWIRVSQIWAGAGWGAMWIPRIGHEVVVDFIEGDPDRPIIVGRVYHGANVPPYALPAEKTKSTIKSNSSQGGGGSNELRFEDKKGSEEVYLHAQKDWTIKVEHDKNQIVGHDETKEVGHDESYKIGHDQALQVDHDRKKLVKNDQEERVGRDKTIDVARHHSETIGANETVNVGGSADRSVGGSETITINTNQSLNVAAVQATNVGGAMTVNVGAAHSLAVGGAGAESVGGNKSIAVGGDLRISTGKKMTTEIGANLEENIAKENKLTVGEKFVLQVGDGTVTVEKNGNVVINGKDITIKGSGKINVEAGSKVLVKSDGSVNVEASGSVKIKGSAVNVN